METLEETMKTHKKNIYSSSSNSSSYGHAISTLGYSFNETYTSSSDG
jgi:hypothetical protein